MDQFMDIDDNSSGGLAESIPEASSTAMKSKVSLQVLDIATPLKPKLQYEVFQCPRVAITTCYLLAILIFIFNISVAVAVSVRWGVDQGLATAISGNCGRVKSLNTVIHVGINVLATLLLGASNYTMQYLNAPTRSDVDKAHRQKTWLDIGIPSLKNIIAGNRTRAIMWVFLLLSSVPLHFLYNSVVFSAIHVKDYVVFIVSEEFWSDSPGLIYDDSISEMVKYPERFSKLAPEDCISAYGVGFLIDRSDVILVTTSLVPDANFFAMNREFSFPRASGNQYAWLCGLNLDPALGYTVYVDYNDECTITQAKVDVNDWNVTGSPVSYCLSRVIEPQCELLFSLNVMIVVIICNAIKVASIYGTLWGDNPPRLITQGDAVASFLNIPDSTTRGMCVVSKDDFQDLKWPNKLSPRAWRSKRRLWFEAASRESWMLWGSFSVLALILVAIYLANGLQYLHTTAPDIGSPASLGFGEESVFTLISWSLPKSGTAGVVTNTLAANAPQLLFSCIYLVYNSIFTSMLAAEEWSLFAAGRHPLRVSRRKGEQLSTYALSLPYKFAIPLLIFSGVMHWLLSQSLFFVLIFVDGVTFTGSAWVTTCVFSPLAIMLTIAVAVIMAVFILINGSRRLLGDAPLVGSCSAAISAACHPRDEESDIALCWNYSLIFGHMTSLTRLRKPKTPPRTNSTLLKPEQSFDSYRILKEYQLEGCAVPTRLQLSAEARRAVA